jgi:hypothetical protein
MERGRTKPRSEQGASDGSCTDGFGPDESKRLAVLQEVTLSRGRMHVVTTRTASSTPSQNIGLTSYEESKLAWAPTARRSRRPVNAPVMRACR